MLQKIVKLIGSALLGGVLGYLVGQDIVRAYLGREYAGKTTLTVPVQAPAKPVRWHVARFLVRHGAPEDRAVPVAQAIVDQARRQHTDAALVTAIMTMENPDLVSGAESDSGAVGLMQVMPFWKEDPGARQACQSTDLANDQVNICYGIYVLRVSIRSRKTVVEGLLSYNGCRTTTNPCGQYPHQVLQRKRALARAIIGEKGDH